MAVFRIPNEGQIVQSNQGDIFGQLWGTFNVDLTRNRGKIYPALPFRRGASDSDLDSDQVLGLTEFDGKYYAAADDLFETNSPGGSWSNSSSFGETLNNTRTDLVVFQNQLIVADTTDLHAYDGSSTTSNWWTTTASGPTLNSGYHHAMHIYRGSAETLIVLDRNDVHSYNGVTVVTMDIDSDYIATAVTSGVDKVWVGTGTEFGGPALVYEWDGASTNPTRAFEIGARAVFAMFTHNNVPYIITEKGEIKGFNGAGFQNVAAFPFAQYGFVSSGVSSGLIQTSPTGRMIYPNGVKVRGDSVFMYVDLEKSGLFDERSISGLWELDMTNMNLYHRGSVPADTDSFGEITSGEAGALFITDETSSRFLIATENDGSNTAGIWYEDYDSVEEHISYIITPEITSGSITDIWQYLTIKFDPMLNSTDKFVIKYRTSLNSEFPVVITTATTATSTTVFTTTDTDMPKVSVGDEVTISSGTGSGRSAIIESISEASGTYTVTLDTAILTASATSFDIVVNKWTYLTEIASQTKTYERIGLGKIEPSDMVQFKIEMHGTGLSPVIRQILIETDTSIPT